MFRGLLAASFIACTSLRLGAATPPSPARVERTRALLESVTEEIRTARAIFSEEVEAGVPRQWSAEEAADALDWARRAFEPPSPTSPGVAPPSVADLVRRAQAGIVPDAPSASIRTWLAKRLEALDKVRNQFREDFAWAALDFAEGAYLDAQRPEDLAPAVQLLEEARLHFRSAFRWLAARNPRPPVGRTIPIPTGESLNHEVVWHLIDFWSVLAVAEPLLLADPAVDPKRFVADSDNWRRLMRIYHRFVARPAIATRFETYETKARFELAKLESQIEEAILNATPSDELQALLARRAAFSPAPVDSKSGSRQPGYFSARNDGRPDYREMIAPHGGGGVRHPIGAPGAQPDYTRVAAWRKAEESGNREQIAKTRLELRTALGRYTGPVRTYLEKQLIAPPQDSAPAKRARPGDKVDEVADVLDALQSLVDQRKKEGRMLGWGTLVRSWEAMRELDYPAFKEIPREADFDWYHISKEPEGNALFRLRDRAGFAVLAAITGDAPGQTKVLATAIIEAMESSIAKQADAQARRILALDRACCVLPPFIHKDYAQGLARLADARKRSGDTAPFALRRMLPDTFSPALATEAVRLLKVVQAARKPSRESAP